MRSVRLAEHSGAAIGSQRNTPQGRGLRFGEDFYGKTGSTMPLGGVRIKEEKDMAVLLTGGAGYIGSHTAVELCAAGCEVVIVDNFSNSSPTAVKRVERITGKKIKLCEVNACDKQAMARVFAENKIDSVVHFAGLKAVGESVRVPLAYYRNNARVIKEGLEAAGFTVYGAVNSPYVWCKTPEHVGSWEFFDKLLTEANIITTPGAGFGPSGEGYVRLTAFGDADATVEAMDRIKKLMA